MSLDLINHKETTSTVDNNGVTWWENPIVSVSISSNGEVYSKKSDKTLKSGTTGNYSVYINGILQPNKFSSLYSRMVLGVKLGFHTIALKNTNKGYVPDNVVLVKRGSRKNLGDVVAMHSNQCSKHHEVCSIKNTNPNVKYYTTHQTKDKYITEDGAIFPTKELADWHQDNVSKGKENAQIVLDYNGGYSLAEKIYLQEVVYNKEKPYAHFVDVMKNDKCVVFKEGKDYCVFDKLHGAGIASLNIYGLNKLKGLNCTEEQAIEINKAVLDYINSFDTLVESIDSLTILLKDLD